MRFPRSSGILMPVFSLPRGAGIGDLGPGAYDFVNFLQAAGQTIWQLLPLGPTARGNSPYSSYSAFAGNPLLISFTQLVDDGLLTASQLTDSRFDDCHREAVDYAAVRSIKEPLLRSAYDSFQDNTRHNLRGEFESFCSGNESWLKDFVLFNALANDSGEADWTQWSPELVQRNSDAIAGAEERLADSIGFAKFEQFIFDLQWRRLKAYANQHNVRIYGDMPIFVAFESADVWCHQELFQLNENGRPSVVAGVPPDYFSATGQMWGNPLYRWERLAESGYEWWIRRLRQAFEFFDLLRIDHFRGFESYWEIPADAENAIGGRWMPAPGDDLFVRVREALGDVPIVAEDLGLITDDVHAMRERLGFPGMRVLQFGFDDIHDAYHRPESYPEHSIAYTGTHDNDTLIGWYQHRCDAGRDNELLNSRLSGDPHRIHTDLMGGLLHSAADTVIIPLQDLLGLDGASRMNTPGEPEGNWTWRCAEESMTDELSAQLRELTHQSHRGEVI